LLGYDLNKIQKELLSAELNFCDLVDYYLENILKTKDHNAYVEVFDDVREQARVLADRIKNAPGSLGPLFGAVVSIKDNLCYKDHKVSAASKMLKNYTSPYSSTVVERLIDADALIIGRTNCDEFSMGSSSETSIYGPVKNAFDLDRVAGGSSGGAAVSVQLDTCLVAVGSDTGGSVRQPACLNGVIGFKPTYGVISRWGLIAYASSLDQIGLMSKHCSTINKVMEQISGPDNYDSTALQERCYKSSYDSKSSELQLGYFVDFFKESILDKSVLESSMAFLEKIKQSNSSLEELDFLNHEYLIPAYYILSSAEASSNLGRFDGIRYGHSSEKDFDEFQELIKTNRTEAFGKEVKKRIILGNYVLSEGYYDAYFTKAQKMRAYFKGYINSLFDKYDYLILPVCTSEAKKIGEKSKSSLTTYYSDIFTVIANLCGIASISVPIQNKDEKTPFGIQILAKSRNDRSLLAFSESLLKL